MNIVDRRLNPKGKSLDNRQRFLKRARAQVMEAVREASAKRQIADVADGDRVAIPTDGIREPGFRIANAGGVRHYVLPGNKEYVDGDRIARPRQGQGGRGNQAAADGDGDDAFQFVLSREEFIDLFLDDLELPDLVKRRIRESESYTWTRAGYSVSGTPSNLNILRTMRQSLGRRIALKRPRLTDIAAVEAELAAATAAEADPAAIAALQERVAVLTRRSRLIPYLDPVDIRYNRFEQVPKPVTRAVMFCLMDVSGSMNEHMKDLAKRFFMLLYLFLTRRYKAIEVVFIRHTHQAMEVDEQTFFYSTETGGTVVSTALAEMRRVLHERYPVEDWNIYAAQASDGDNLASDNPVAARLLEEVILPVCQYFAYIEVGPEQREWGERETSLWRTYQIIADPDLPFAMRRVRRRAEIFPVFRELFARERTAA